ncbi:tetratricopeptide repeat protein [Curvivirga sp.]|uniref:tetratricopeptide repeat protein n=1 Tax=Curvivirga sp. TaxID=2856848 RepID=UPI003B5958D8
MWTRFSNGFLKPKHISSSANAVKHFAKKDLLNSTSTGTNWRKLFCAGLVSTSMITGLGFFPDNVSYAQQGVDNSSVNQKFQQDAFIQLRFTALSLDTLDEVGQALEGLVRALLARGDVEMAIEESDRIEDTLWQARAFLSIARYYRLQGFPEEARKFLVKSYDGAEDFERIEFSQHLYTLISSEYASLGDLQNAVSSAGNITSTLNRMNALQKAARIFLQQADDGQDATTSKSSVTEILRATFKEASTLPGSSQTLIDVFVNIARSQARAGDIEGANITLKYALDKVEKEKEIQNWHTRALARIASAYTYAKTHSMAMDVMRRIPEGGERAIALSAVAKSMAEIGNIDAALPLFTLAKEQANLEQKDERRERILSLLIRDQTFVGRLADAFVTAGLIKNPEAQATAIMNMGFVLVDQNKFKEAEVLLDYIPYLGMRAPIFAALARDKFKNSDNPEAASMLLAQALEPVNGNLNLEMLPGALKAVLSAQLNYGSPEYDEGIFRQAYELTKLIPDNLTRVNALAHLATADAARGRIEEAKKVINNAWTLAFLYNGGPDYAKALANITQSQIATEQMLDAMDTAARIPLPSEDKINDRAPDGSFRAPRFDSITSVGVAAAKLHDTDMAIRSARLIKHPPARAAALAAVAVAIALPDASLREIIGIGPTDRWSYDFLKVDKRALEITEQHVIGQQEILRPQLDESYDDNIDINLLEELANSEI